MISKNECGVWIWFLIKKIAMNCGDSQTSCVILSGHGSGIGSGHCHFPLVRVWLGRPSAKVAGVHLSVVCSPLAWLAGRSQPAASPEVCPETQTAEMLSEAAASIMRPSDTRKPCGRHTEWMSSLVLIWEDLRGLFSDRAACRVKRRYWAHG